MKNLKKSVLVLAVAMATIFSSCSKSEPAATPAAATGSGVVTATIDGVAFTSLPAISNIQMMGNTVTVQGGNANGTSIQIQVAGLTTGPVAGTYKLYNVNSSNFIGTAVFSPGISAPTAAYSSIGCDANLPQTGFTPNGTITFTTLSAAKIEGTFKFNCASLQSCTDIKNVTSGTFSKTF